MNTLRCARIRNVGHQINETAQNDCFPVRESHLRQIQKPLTESRRAKRKKQIKSKQTKKNRNNKLLTPNSENNSKWMDILRVRDEYCLLARRIESIEMKSR